MSFQIKKIVSLVVLLTYPLLTLAFLQNVLPTSPLAHAQSVGRPGTKQVSTGPSARAPVPVHPGGINMSGRLEIGDIELLRSQTLLRAERISSSVSSRFDFFARRKMMSTLSSVASMWRLSSQ